MKKITFIGIDKKVEHVIAFGYKYKNYYIYVFCSLYDNFNFIEKIDYNIIKSWKDCLHIWEEGIFLKEYK